MPEAVFEDALLCSDLCRRLEMLHGTPATDAKILAMRPYPGDRTGNHIDQMRQFITGLSAEACVLYNFTREGAVNKNRLALG